MMKLIKASLFNSVELKKAKQTGKQKSDGDRKKSRLGCEWKTE